MEKYLAIKFVFVLRLIPNHICISTIRLSMISLCISVLLFQLTATERLVLAVLTVQTAFSHMIFSKPNRKLEFLSATDRT